MDSLNNAIVKIKILLILAGNVFDSEYLKKLNAGG
jgi:hypothetical protein